MTETNINKKPVKCNFRLTKQHVTHNCAKSAEIFSLFWNFCTEHYQEWQVMNQERMK